jgi:membrane fusion protein, multidrug efflux system
MKKLFPTFLCCAAFALAQTARAGDEAAAKSEKDDVVKIKQGANGESILTIDEATQKRLGIVVANPVAISWQPEIRATGRVADPLAFASAAADYETARAAAAASQAELERTQKLAAQDNASARVVETAQAAAAKDRFALQAAKAKFTGDWGVQLATQANLAAYAEQLQTDDIALVKITLPSGTFPKPLSQSAQIEIFNNGGAVAGSFADDLGIDPATQMQTLLFSVKQKLPRNVAVTGNLKISGEPVAGVTVPASAVLRHENKGWVFVQTGAAEFTREEIQLNRAADGGFFSAELSATNRVVVTGAQTLLSAELSGGNFNSGQRD